MKLSLSLICEQIAPCFPQAKVTGKGSRKVSGISFFDPHLYDDTQENSLPAREDFLQFLPDHNSLPNPLPPASPVWTFLYYSGARLPESADGILIPDHYSIWSVANQIMDVFRRFEDWEHKTREALCLHQSISDILTLCNLITPDTVWLSDASLKRLGNSSPTLMSEVSAIWNYQTEYGYVPMDVVKKLIENGEMDQLNTKRRAYICQTEGFNLPYTCKNIFQKGKLKAHLFFISIYSNPNHTNAEMAEHLGNLLEPHLEQYGSILESGAFHESYFRDILEGKLTARYLISAQLSYFSWNLTDRYILALMKTEDHKALKNDLLLYVLPAWSSNLNCQFFSNDQYLFLLFHDTDARDAEKILSPIMDKNHCHCVISRPFHDLSLLPDVYQRGLRCMKIGMDFSPERSVYNDDTYGLYQIAQQLLDNHPITDLCHESVLQLYTYDQNHNTAFMETLYHYLTNDRNVLKTAKAMFIHRNTLNYRLGKLNQLIGIEKISAEELHYILFSIYLIKYAGKQREE